MIRGQWMRTRFTRGHGVVVTARTGIGGLAVIDGWQGVPVVAGMAGLAQVAGHRMACRFKGAGADAVVAAATGAGLTCH